MLIIFLDELNDAEFVSHFYDLFLRSFVQRIHVGPGVQLQTRMIAH